MKCLKSSSADKQINTIRTLQNKNSTGFGVSLVCTLLQNRANPEKTEHTFYIDNNTGKVIHKFRFCKSQGRGAKKFYAEGEDFSHLTSTKIKNIDASWKKLHTSMRLSIRQSTSRALKR